MGGDVRRSRCSTWDKGFNPRLRMVSGTATPPGYQLEVGVAVSLTDQGSFPPPALPGFTGTTTLSATPGGRFRASRHHRWPAPLANHPKGLPVLHTTPLSHMPSPLPRRNRWVRTSFSFPNGSGLPPDEDGSASALPFSRPDQRSLHVTAYTLAESLTDPFTPECFSRFVTSTTVPIATGWNDPCRVGFAPTEVVHLCTAHFITAG